MGLDQTVKENSLTLQNLQARGGEGKPGRAIQFWKHQAPLRSWRPLHLEHVAVEVRGIPVVFHGPNVDELTSRLPCLAKRQWLSKRPVARLFGELPLLLLQGRSRQARSIL
jgi:hypothetical protein